MNNYIKIWFSLRAKRKKEKNFILMLNEKSCHEKREKFK